jgi:hypothetical protein
MAAGAALLTSICLFWYGAETVEATVMVMAMPGGGYLSIGRPGSWWAIFAGASLLGGVLGAAIGQVFRDERGGAASMGAYVGALAGPAIVVILVFAFIFVAFLRFGPG